MMNVPPDAIKDEKGVILGLGEPVVIDINGQDAVAIHVVVDEREVFKVINDLTAAGPLASLCRKTSNP